MGSISFVAGPKESQSYPLHHHISGPKGEGGDITGGTSSLRPHWGHCWHLRNLHAPNSTAGRTYHPLPHPSTSTSCQILQVSQIEGLSQMYICRQCKKHISNKDLMVSHCLQEHPGVCLVCSQCEMSYLDPSKFCVHGRDAHNLLFY